MIGLQKIFRNELNVVFARTFLARSVAALGSLVLMVVLGRLYGPAGVGVLALAQSILLGAGIIANYGMDNGLMKFVGQDQPHINTTKLLRWSVGISLSVSLVIGLAIFFGRKILGDLFQNEYLSTVLIGIAIAVPAFTLGYLLSGFFKGIQRPATACLLEGGIIALVSALLVSILNLIVSGNDLATIGFAYAIAAWLVFFYGAFKIFRWFTKIERNKSYTSESEDKVLKKRFFSTSHEFFVMSLANLVQTVISMLIAGWMLSSEDLGLFKSSQQTAMLISFVLIVNNAILPPRFAKLNYTGQFKELEKLARKGASLGILVASPLIIVCLFFPHSVLTFIGAGFAEAVPLLRLLALAQIVNLATGSVGFMLAMSGHERIMRNIAWLSSVVGVLLLFALIPPFGAMGAAVGVAVILVMQNLIAVFFVWQRLGIWILPFPNVLSLSGVPTRNRWL
jgi:O-antigen/teichoic acid export membrane protein